ncbi:hypothetical protein EDB19DRAFT_1957714 [Suillus lakei]|nr:hypothetical protein EDB19DRAFT_1957714 [Suillus lakei]
MSPTLITQAWPFLLNGLPNYIVYNIPGSNVQRWILVLVNITVVRAPLTLGLHCSELITNVIRDERYWRCVAGRKGLRTTTNPLKPVFIIPLSLMLFIAKPFLPLFIFACVFTIMALRRPRGPQPAAYGHVQTLANLVEYEWSPVMWWGHKVDEICIVMLVG